MSIDLWIFEVAIFSSLAIAGEIALLMKQQLIMRRTTVGQLPTASRAALALAASYYEANAQAAMVLAKEAFDTEPGLAPAAINYAAQLRRRDRNKQALYVLRTSWSANPHPDTAAAYTEAEDDKLLKVREVVILVRSNPDHLESYLAISRAALDAGLHYEARRQLELAIQAGSNDARLWMLLAICCQLQGDATGQQKALAHLTNADPSPVWLCEICSTKYDSWLPACKTCGSIGSIRWFAPSTPNLGSNLLDNFVYK